MKKNFKNNVKNGKKINKANEPYDNTSLKKSSLLSLLSVKE